MLVEPRLVSQSHCGLTASASRMMGLQPEDAVPGFVLSLLDSISLPHQKQTFVTRSKPFLAETPKLDQISISPLETRF